MANVIKGDSSHVDPFQHDILENIDIDGTGEKGYVDPAAILAEAREEAAAKVQEAYAEGMRRGIAKGEQDFQEHIGQSGEVLQQVASALNESRDLYIQEIEQHIAKFAQMIAEKIIRQEVSVKPEIVLNTVQALLTKLFDQEVVSIFVNPNDLELLVQNRESLLEEFSSIQHLDIQPDEKIESGGCLAKTSTLVIDGTLRVQMDEIANQILQTESHE